MLQQKKVNLSLKLKNIQETLSMCKASLTPRRASLFINYLSPSACSLPFSLCVSQSFLADNCICEIIFKHEVAVNCSKANCVWLKIVLCTQQQTRLEYAMH